MLMNFCLTADTRGLFFMKSKNIKKIFVEVAKTPDRMSRGLMFRDRLDNDSGMIFIFQQPKILSFWGMNTFIPLDIAFVDESGVIRDIKRIKRHDLTSVKSPCPCKYAIEMEDGWFSKNGFKPGDFVEVSSAETDSSIFFVKHSHDRDEEKYAQQKNEDNEVNEEDYAEPVAPESEEIDEDDLEELEDLSSDQAVDDSALQPVEESPVKNDSIIVKEDAISPPKFNNIFDALRWSGQNNQVIRITYKTKKGHVITRDIEPYKIFFSRKSGSQVLKSFDQTSNMPRFYIIMNISSFGFPGRKFVSKFIFNNRR